MSSTIERAMSRDIAAPVSATPGPGIGALLVESGVLSASDAERVAEYQHQHGMRYGEAATELGLISDEDLQHALAVQHDYPVLHRQDAHVARDVIAAYRPWSTEVEQLRAVRSQLKLRYPHCRALAIVSPARGEGRTFVASNLAVVFSQLGERTLLIDADLRSPRQHLLFGLHNRTGLSSMLTGRCNDDGITDVPKLHGLYVLPAGPLPPNPLELLSRPTFTTLLGQLASQFDTVVVDTPAARRCADGQHAAAAAGAALMVARKHQTGIADLEAFSEALMAGGTKLVGCVLNGA